MKSTITDVAQRAGVSIKTVSRVLNHEPNVTEKTRSKVNEAATALRYRPNLSARSLAGSRSYLIALLYDNPSAEYIAKLQRGATDACRTRGYHVMVEHMRLTDDRLSEDMELLLERLPVDGVILTPPLADSPQLLTILNEAQTPYVQVSPRSSTLVDESSILIDDVSAAYEMTKFLIDAGHIRIGFICGDESHGSSALRRQGYLNALKEAGIQIEESLIVNGDYSFQSGCRAARRLLSLATTPSAIFASNDNMAAGVISVAGSLGISIPDRLSVCGFDDTELASMLFPALTTIRQPIYDMGALAAKTLMGPAPGVKKRPSAAPKAELSDPSVNYELVVRASTAPRKV